MHFAFLSLPGDFDTPEYARYDAVQVRKWESNLGMDPFSYGYNVSLKKCVSFEKAADLMAFTSARHAR